MGPSPPQHPVFPKPCHAGRVTGTPVHPSPRTVTNRCCVIKTCRIRWNGASSRRRRRHATPLPPSVSSMKHASKGASRLVAGIACIGGIYGAYLTQGWVTEELQSKRFGSAQERFPHIACLSSIQALGCYLFSSIIIVLMGAFNGSQRDKISTEKRPQLVDYLRVAITNSIGPTCGVQALKNVSYPAQILAKSCKTVPVMLVKSLVYGVHFSPLEYLSALLIGGGIGTFAWKTSAKVLEKLEAPNAPLGYLLIAINLVFDGYTNAAQDHLRDHYPRVTPFDMMQGVNFWTALITGTYTWVLTTTGVEVWVFCVRNPEALRDVFLFCLTGAVGQIFIFLTIKSFGTLTLTTITTTRKFFNILLSVVLSHNPLLPLQWAGVGLVFSGLFLSQIAKPTKSKPGTTATTTTTTTTTTAPVAQKQTKTKKKAT